MRFRGTGQQQDLLCIIMGHKANPEDIPSLLRLAVMMGRSWRFALHSALAWRKARGQQFVLSNWGTDESP